MNDVLNANSEDNEVITNQNNIDSDNETVYSEESVSADDNSGKEREQSVAKAQKN